MSLSQDLTLLAGQLRLQLAIACESVSPSKERGGSRQRRLPRPSQREASASYPGPRNSQSRQLPVEMRRCCQFAAQARKLHYRLPTVCPINRYEGATGVKKLSSGVAEKPSVKKSAKRHV